MPGKEDGPLRARAHSSTDMAAGGVPVVSSTRVLAGDPVTAVVCMVGATRSEIPLRSD